MRKSALAVLAVGVSTALLVSACSSSGGGGGGGKSGGTSGGASSSSGGGGGGGGKPQVGVILPDTTTSIRYNEFDKPLLTKAFNAAGIKSDIQNAGGDKSKFASIAQSMTGEGVKVLIIDSIDGPSGAAVEAQAKSAGVQVIDYDRVNLGGTAQYYVSFDNEKIGELQGQGMIDCLAKQKAPTPAKVIQLDGGTDVDNNAVLFKQGVEKVFKANTDKIKVLSDSTIKNWDIDTAAPTFSQALTAAGGQVDGVYAANDDIANAVIGVLKSKGLDKKVAVTGQDAGAEGLKNILSGEQCGTIYKSYAQEAAAAAKLAIAIAKGQDPSSAGVTLSKFDDPKSPSRDLKAYLLPAKFIMADGVKQVVDAKQVTAAELCKGLTAQCQKAGISG